MSELQPPRNPMDIRTRLGELKQLSNGWLDGYGVAPDHAGLDWLADAFEAHWTKAGIKPPYLFPTPDGGIEAETTIGYRDITVEINLYQKCAACHELNHDTGVEVWCTLDLGNVNDWLAMVAFVNGAAS